MADLFSTLTIKDVTLRNRIGVSPMCQYQATEGFVSDWHMMHLGARAAGGAGLVIAEMSAVSPEGRITPRCAGIWSDAHADAWAPIARFITRQGAVAGIQIAHAGRKASANRPWEGDDHIPEGDRNGWTIIGPSAEAWGAILPRAPEPMTIAQIHQTQADFADAARRALEVGFEWLELHFAHGYLGQSFFSPIANKRTDAYGGSFENRARFLLETVDAVRAVWPERLPLTARLGVSDFNDASQPFEESIELARLFRARGVDLLDVSIGFNSSDVGGVPFGPGWIAPWAQRIKEEAGIPVGMSWLMNGTPALADGLIRDGKIDLLLIGHAMLDDPNWAFHAAQALGVSDPHALLAAPYAHWLRIFHSHGRIAVAELAAQAEEKAKQQQ